MIHLGPKCSWVDDLTVSIRLGSKATILPHPCPTTSICRLQLLSNVIMAKGGITLFAVEVLIFNI